MQCKFKLNLEPKGSFQMTHLGYESPYNTGVTIDFQDLYKVEKAFILWSNEFTKDCNKITRGTEYKWHNRNIGKINAVAQRTGDRLGC